MFDLPASTLRYYEDAGILTNVGRDENNQRIYKEEHVHRLGTICCFKRAGMSIAQLQQFLQYEETGDSSIDDIVALLQNQKDALEEKLEKLQQDYVHIQKKLRYYSDIREALQTHKDKPCWEDYK